MQLDQIVLKSSPVNANDGKMLENRLSQSAVGPHGEVVEQPLVRQKNVTRLAPWCVNRVGSRLGAPNPVFGSFVSCCSV
jgi:hypothetical protein